MTKISSPVYGWNFNDQFDLQAITDAHARVRQPCVLMLSANAITFSGLSYLVGLFKVARLDSNLPFYLQLDHGRDLNLIRKCIQLGFDLIMADFSHEDFHTNVAKTREVVDMAHQMGVMVEGELGVIPTLNSEGSSGNACLTEPETAPEFIAQTGVDLLAVSVGNVHGDLRQKPLLNIDLIKAIARQAPVPLVLHGADFYPNSVLRQVFRSGIIKANLGPELRCSYLNALRQSVVEDGVTDHRQALKHAREVMEESVMKRLEVLTDLNQPN